MVLACQDPALALRKPLLFPRSPSGRAVCPSAQLLLWSGQAARAALPEDHSMVQHLCLPPPSTLPPTHGCSCRFYQLTNLSRFLFGIVVPPGSGSSWSKAGLLHPRCCSCELCPPRVAHPCTTDPSTGSGHPMLPAQTGGQLVPYLNPLENEPLK